MSLRTADTTVRPLRRVVPHVDDLGSSHGANRAFLELARQGFVTCGSVMVPAPWFREIAEAGRDDPGLDLGIHLTLTSEWEHCRWAPVSTVSPASGLIDGDGYFWRDLASFRRALVPEAAEAELRAQIDRAIAAGLRPTHIDAHMGAAMVPELLDAHVRLAREYRLLPVVPRSILWPPDLAAYRRTLDRLDAAGAPVLDHCRGTLPVSPSALEEGWSKLIGELPPGVTHLALHCTAPGDFEAMAPEHAAWRYAEYDMLARGLLANLCAQAEVGVCGLREFQQTWHESSFVEPALEQPPRDPEGRI